MSCRTTSGGSVSVSLAKAVTGLDDSTVTGLFHALKREAHGIHPPSEFEISEWRDRQLDLLGRMTRMTENRKDSIHRRLFRSRSEPVPDGPTFYAWSRIEARARQEATLRNLPDAIDLEPPGSQAHLYDLGEDGRPTRVWYASYGSNLHEDRFLAYINGGTVEGTTRHYDGCTDTTPPEGDIPIRFEGARPHFALTSRVWKGGIAFIDANKGETAQSLGRAYNIGINQFDQVVAQENGNPVKTSKPIPLDEVLATGRATTGPGPYQTVLHIGDYNGAPVLTFTAPFSTRDALTHTGSLQTNVRLPVRTNKPSPAYLRMIGSGLGETFHMDEIAQADYLRGCPGGDRYSRQTMVSILRGHDPEPPKKATAANPTAGSSTDVDTPSSEASQSRGGRFKPPSTDPAAAPGATNRQQRSPRSKPPAAEFHTPSSGYFPNVPPAPFRPRRNKTSGQTNFPQVPIYTSPEQKGEGIRQWEDTVASYVLIHGNANIEHRKAQERLNRARRGGQHAEIVSAEHHAATVRNQRREIKRLVDQARTRLAQATNATVVTD